MARRSRPKTLRELCRRLLHSKTVWVALGQALVGGLAAFVASNPTWHHVGWIAVGKSMLDIFLRYTTTHPVGEPPDAYHS